LLRLQVERLGGRAARPCVVGERSLADAPRDEGAEREDEQRRYRLAAESN